MEEHRYPLYKFTLHVRGVGDYESDTLRGLFWELLKHRWWHFRMFGKWED